MFQVKQDLYPFELEMWFWPNSCHFWASYFSHLCLGLSLNLFHQRMWLWRWGTFGLTKEEGGAVIQVYFVKSVPKIIGMAWSGSEPNYFAGFNMGAAGNGMFGTVTAWSACVEHIHLKLGEEFNKILMTFVEKLPTSALVAVTAWWMSPQELISMLVLLDLLCWTSSLSTQPAISKRVHANLVLLKVS